MGREAQGTSVWMGVPLRYISLVLLTLQSTTFILLLHYSRVVPVVDGRRYITSTAVFLNEVIKLAICLTVALYDVSKTVPPSMPATSLFSSLSALVFSGDSWKLAIPASLYTLANSLQYIGLSNLEAATFQVTYQLKLVTSAIFGLALLRRTLPFGKWMALLVLMAGIAIVQLPNGNLNDPDHPTQLHFPRSLEEFRNFGAPTPNNLHKRSATYEGIEEDLMLGNPHMNGRIGLLATVVACVASGLAGVSFEKVLRDSSSATTIWVRNVQLALYSIFPSLFIGVVFFDGEKVAKGGFFEGYNWIVWSVIAVQAVGGIAASFCISKSDHVLRNSAAGFSIVLSSLGSVWFLDSNASGNFILGTVIVLAATYAFTLGLPQQGPRARPPPIKINIEEKSDTSGNTSPRDVVSPPNDFSIKLPTTPLISESAALSTSRPGSPMVSSTRGYFAKQHHRDS